MGFRASGDITVIAKSKRKADEIMESAETLFDEVNRDSDVEVTLIHYYENYHDDDVNNFLDSISDLTESGFGHFSGDEDCQWRFRFVNGKWIEEDGQVFYSDNDIVEYLITQGYQVTK